MGKTKRLAEELTEESRPENVLDEPSKTPRSEKGTSVVSETKDMKAVSQELNNALVAYLQTKPFAEVNNLIVSLSQAPMVKVTFTHEQGN